MTIEAKLDELIEIGKAQLAALNAIGSMAPAQVDSAEAPAKRGRKPKAETQVDAAADATEEKKATYPVLQGDPDGTRYWVSEEAKQVYAQLPGQPDPTDQTFKIEPSSLYATKKAEFAKNAQADAATTSPAPAPTEPSATPAPATASAPTSASAEPTWDEVVTKLQALSKDPAHGNMAVKKIMNQIDPNAKSVPGLKDLGKNAEIIAAVDALYAPAGDDALFG